MPKPVLKRDAKEQSADALIQNLREKLETQEQSAEAHIQAIREELDEARAAKEQQAEAASDFEKWYYEAEDELNKEKDKNRQIDEGTNSIE